MQKASAAAKARGVPKGRARVLGRRAAGQGGELIAAGVPKARITAQLGDDRSTLYRALARKT